MFQKNQLSVLDWFMFLLLMAVPLLNLVVIVLILFDDNSNPTLRSFIKTLIFIAIIMVLVVIRFWETFIDIFEQYSDDGNDDDGILLSWVFHQLYYK